VKIVCPKCQAHISANAVNIAQGVAFCKDCDEGFSLNGLAREQEIPRIERPADARSTLTRSAEHIAVVLPPGGLKGIGCFMTFFTLFWNGVTWTVGFGMLAALVGGTGTGPALGVGFFGLLFMVPFVLIGLVTGVIALYCVFGETLLAMDRQHFILDRRLFRYKYVLKYPFADITKIELAEAYRQNESPVYGVGIFLKSKHMPLAFGSSLSEEEKGWLLGELHAFWREAAARPGAHG